MALCFYFQSRIIYKKKLQTAGEVLLPQPAG